LTDDEIRDWWQKQGGSFHGPNIETGSMREDLLIPLLRKLLSETTCRSYTYNLKENLE
jgi:hypothetical protein